MGLVLDFPVDEIGHGAVDVKTCYVRCNTSGNVARLALTSDMRSDDDPGVCPEWMTRRKRLHMEDVQNSLLQPIIFQSCQ